MLPMWFRNTLGTVSGINNVVVSLLISIVPVSVLALIGAVIIGLSLGLPAGRSAADSWLDEDAGYGHETLLQLATKHSSGVGFTPSRSL